MSNIGKNLLPESSWWKERAHSLYGYIVILLVIFLIFMGISRFFPKRTPSTSTTKTTVASGGVANITNINNPLADLKQGIYGRLASDRGSIGVFKEVMPNIDVSLGSGKDWDNEDEFIEVETRYKF